jgi:RNA polymerase sigma-70 factor (ECF subfamily)
MMKELELFYDEHIDKVYKYFYIQCLNRHLAEDLSSETFVAFIAKAKNGSIDNQTKYLYAIMRNVWTNYLRKKYKESVDSYESIEDFEDHAIQIIENFEAQSLSQRAGKYIDRLPDKQRKVAELRLVQGLGIREIAKELGRTISYVKTTQNRALKELKLMLEEPEFGGVNK